MMLDAEGKSSKEFKSIQLRNSSLTVDLATDADEGYYDDPWLVLWPKRRWKKMKKKKKNWLYFNLFDWKFRQSIGYDR